MDQSWETPKVLDWGCARFVFSPEVATLTTARRRCRRTYNFLGICSSDFIYQTKLAQNLREFQLLKMRAG
jgi:hypothetical protein